MGYKRIFCCTDTISNVLYGVDKKTKSRITHHIRPDDDE